MKRVKGPKAGGLRGRTTDSKSGKVGSTPTPPGPGKKTSSAPSKESAGLPPRKPAKVKRGSVKKERPAKLGDPRPGETSPAPGAVPAAPPEALAFVPPPDFHPPAEFAFWNDQDHSELAEAWLAMKEQHQKFFREWYTNGFKATEAYVQTYNQQNRHVARVSACQLLASANIIRLRRAIWKVQMPPIELMAAAEQAALEADDATDPKAYRTHLMKLTAVKSIREAHGLQPAQDFNLNVKGKVDHQVQGEVKHTLDTSDIEDLLNGGG